MKNLVTNYSHYIHKGKNRLKSMVISYKYYKTHCKWQLITYSQQIKQLHNRKFLLMDTNIT
jgi:hypothetical protein